MHVCVPEGVSSFSVHGCASAQCMPSHGNLRTFQSPRADAARSSLSVSSAFMRSDAALVEASAKRLRVDSSSSWAAMSSCSARLTQSSNQGRLSAAASLEVWLPVRLWPDQLSSYKGWQADDQAGRQTDGRTDRRICEDRGRFNRQGRK